MSLESNSRGVRKRKRPVHVLEHTTEDTELFFLSIWSDAAAMELALGNRRSSDVLPQQHASAEPTLAQNAVATLSSRRLLSDGTGVHPSVLYGCLIVPVAFGFWWYWTKNTARRVMRGMVTDGGAVGGGEECSANETASATNASFASRTADPDPFRSWDDVMHQQENNHALRFVRWFHHGSTAASSTERARCNVQATTLHNLRQRPPMMTEGADTPILTSAHTGSWDFGGAADASSFYDLDWQCLQDTTSLDVCVADNRGCDAIFQSPEDRVDGTYVVETVVTSQSSLA